MAKKFHPSANSGSWSQHTILGLQANGNCQQQIDIAVELAPCHHNTGRTKTYTSTVIQKKDDNPKQGKMPSTSSEDSLYPLKRMFQSGSTILCNHTRLPGSVYCLSHTQSRVACFSSFPQFLCMCFRKIIIYLYLRLYVCGVCVCVCVCEREREKSHQLYLTLCDPMDSSQPASFSRGILQARILQWVATPPPGFS